MVATVLVNDRCLVRGAAGIAVYLRNVLRHWPADAAVRPVSFCVDRLGRRPLGDSIAAGLSLRPLADLDASAGGRRPPAWVRAGVELVYDRAFRGEFRRGGHRAYLEPNHIAIRGCGPTVTTAHDLTKSRSGELASLIHGEDRRRSEGEQPLSALGSIPEDETLSPTWIHPRSEAGNFLVPDRVVASPPSFLPWPKGVHTSLTQRHSSTFSSACGLESALSPQ